MHDRDAQFLDALYLGVRDRAGFDASLNILSDMFDVASSILLDFDAARPEVSAQASVGVFSGERLLQYQREFAAIDPAPPAFMLQPAGTAIPTYRLLPEEKRRPSAFFGDFFRPMGLEECLGGTLASAKGRFAMVGLQRSPDRKPFDDDDIVRLEALMPHLARALQLRRAFLDLEGTAGALSELCDRLAAGVIALDDQGQNIFINRAARSMADARDGLSVDRRGRPFSWNRAANNRLAALENNVRSGGAGGITRLPRPDSKAPYGVVVAPFLLQEGTEKGVPPPRGVLFVVHDPMRADQTPAAAIATLFGLPAATAGLAAALSSGEDLKDYADRHGISMNTVRYHLKTAFARTGVHSQAELVRRITAALRDLADHRQDT